MIARTVVLIGVLVAITAPTARAASGNGLYAPYPGVVGSGPAQAYYAQLGLALTAAQLRDGRFTGSLAPAPANRPSERAGARGGGASIPAAGAVLALAVLAAAVASVRRAAAHAAPDGGPLRTPRARGTDLRGR